jgi:alpha-glucosidase
MIRNNFFSAIFLALVLQLQASQVTIIVTSLPVNTPSESQIFIAGNLNDWNPGSTDHKLIPNSNGHPTIVVQGTGTISFKFTRGSWATVEGNANGGYLPNRSFTFGSADTLNVTILSWEDLGGPNSTAAENVSIMSPAFFMPQFNRNRRIWIYLPPDYDTSGIDYPVLYMHDGQNLFDNATAFAGEWQVDETLNLLHQQGKPVPIVIGVDNGGGHRIAEYTPWAHSQHGGGDGHLYADFIVETLKPYVDENYRTLPGRENTGVMGSSLGGLISFYIAHKYQEVFSKAGVFSPSFWFSDQVYDFASETGKTHSMKYYLMGGSAESSTMVPKMEQMADTLFSVGFGQNEVSLNVIQGGQHNEAFWRSQFKDAFEWLFLTESTSTGDNLPKFPVKIKNYGRNIWFEAIDSHANGGPFIFELYGLGGQIVYSKSIEPNQVISMPFLPPGLFVARVFNNQTSVAEKIFLH